MSTFLIQSNENIYTYTTQFNVISASLKEEDFVSHGLTEEALASIPSSAWDIFKEDFSIISLVSKEYEIIHHAEEKESIIQETTPRGKIGKVSIDISSYNDNIEGVEVK